MTNICSFYYFLVLFIDMFLTNAVLPSVEIVTQCDIIKQRDIEDVRIKSGAISFVQLASKTH